MKTKRKYPNLKSELEQIRINNLTRLDQARWHWNSLANERIFEFSKNITAAASLVIPLILIMLGAENITKLFTHLDRTLLSISLTLLIASLIFGIKHVMHEANFFDSWSEVENKRASIYSQPLTLVDERNATAMLYNMMGKSKKLINRLETKSDNSDLYTQLALVVMSVLLITFVTIRVLNSPLPSPNILLK